MGTRRSARAESSYSVWRRAGASGLVVGVLVGSIVGLGAALAQNDSAQAATTSSTVTVKAEGYDLDYENAPFPDLEVTVSQTKDLVSQGLVVSWTGGGKSEPPAQGNGGRNFLQIAQCWGEDPQNPGHPDRTTCQYGGSLTPGTTRDNTVNRENVAEQDEQYSVLSDDFFTPSYTSIPFRSVDGVRIENVVKDPETQSNIQLPGVDVNTNQFFTQYTTNEVKWAGSGANGEGRAPFEVQTAMQSPGLGCGTPQGSGDAVVGQSCWLVIIPRGVGDSGEASTNKSGLLWDAWQHHIAVKLDFKPLGVRCTIGGAEKQLAGSELVGGAIAAWQPELCLGEQGAPFVLSAGNEPEALVRASGTDPSPLAFASRPLELLDETELDPLQYAPVALAGLAVSFSVDRQVKPVGDDVPQEYKDRTRLPFTEMKLTPRLIAKLLTASYLDTLPTADTSYMGDKNPRTIVQDPDFLAVNDPEWAYQIIVGASVGDLLVPSGRSDLAVQLWRYVMADADARAFLDGKPDPWGMLVNPWYSTNPEVNKTGIGLPLPMDSFPKADPIEKPDTTVADPTDGTGAVNLVTKRPYTSDFENGAYLTLRGDGLILGTWDKLAVPPKFGKPARELLGSQKVLGLTTTAAASRYQTVTASLLNPAGQFVAPTDASLLAAAAAMTPTDRLARVLEYDPAGPAAAAAPTAYPLAMPVYAALNPLQTDEAQRGVYAHLIRYAVEDGQDPGTDIGQLPPGYAPLPQSWVNRALVAANDIEQGISPNAQPPVTPPLSSNDGGGVVAPPQSPPSAGGGGGGAVIPPQVQAPGDTNPVATGNNAGALVGAETPKDPEVGPVAAAVPAGLLSGLAAALAVPLVTRIRRRP